MLKLFLSSAVALAIASAARPACANLNFNLIPEPGTSQIAIDGFTAAANLWSAVITDNITINLQIGFSALGPNIIGGTSSEFIERSYFDVLQALATRRTSADDFSSYAALQPGVGYERLINHTSNNPNGANSATPYVDTMDRVGLTTANAKVLGLLPQDDSVDAIIRFSSSFSFDFGHGETIAPGQFDFVGVAAHEIGHVLGFISGVDDIDQLNGLYAGGDFSSNLIDLFRFSTLSLSFGDGYSDYTADNSEKYFSVDGGETSVALFANGVNFGDGRQASHWKEDEPPVGIMDPTAALSERLTISPDDLRLFDVLGFTVIPEPGVSVLFGGGLLFLLARRRYHAHNVKAC